VKRALELAAASEHPQWQWLTSLFAEMTASTHEEAHDVFFAEEKIPACLLLFSLFRCPGLTRFGCMKRSCVNLLIPSTRSRKHVFPDRTRENNVPDCKMLLLKGSVMGCVGSGDAARSVVNAKKTWTMLSDRCSTWRWKYLFELLGESDPQPWFF
jgi:hypothetical protein